MSPMIVRTNMYVNTPIGKGVVQGRWNTDEWLIRLPINDVTRAHLGSSLTPHAIFSGLWAFKQADLQ